jgi:hypothetical protein
MRYFGKNARALKKLLIAAVVVSVSKFRMK